MADYLRKYKSLYSSTCNTSFGTGTGVTITPATVTGLPTTTEITLTFDRVDSSGTATASKMERVIGTISAGNFVVRTSPSSGRGADSTTEQSHTSNCVIEMIWNAKDWNDMVDWATTQHNQDGTHGAITSTNATLTTPKVITSINDSNGNEVIKTPATASAVNEITVTNAATTFWPEIASSGGDTNIDIGIKGKGSGSVKLGTAGLKFPNTDGTANYVLKTDGSGNLSWAAQSATSSRTRSIWMPANIFQSAEGTPTLSAGSNADTPSAWLLDDTAAVESVAGQVIIPEDWLSGAVTPKIYFAMVSATSGNIVVDSRILSVASNADVTAAGTSQSDTISVPGTAGLLKIATRGATFTPSNKGDIVRVSIRRLGSNGSDTATGDMRFLGVKLEYTADM